MKYLNPMLFFIALILLYHACVEQPRTSTKRYGRLNHSNEYNEVFLNLYNYASYRDLVDSIESVVCHGGIPLLIVQDSLVQKQIGLMNICKEDVGCLLIKRRNVLCLRPNYILHEDKQISIDSLGVFMHRHYTNYGKLKEFSSNPNKFIIEIRAKELNPQELELLLKNILRIYDSIHTEALLHLWLELPIPPPPPPPPNGWQSAEEY